MKAKVIKSEADYKEALAYLETLMDAEPGSPEEEQLELFSMLVEKYEEENFPIELPDPVEAIKSRMEQEGLSRKDLVKYIGSQSKVSEVLNHKRPLSLSMMRALHEGLGIPAEVLLHAPGQAFKGEGYDYRDYPFKEMFKRGYFEGFRGTLPQAKELCDELLGSFFSVFDRLPPVSICCKHGPQDLDLNALRAWQARALLLAAQEDLSPYSKDQVNEDFFAEVVNLSNYSIGPRLVKEVLNKKGIHFILLPHLPKTYLDGACFYGIDDRPILGMTLRHDRLDNFWFTLVHELAHLYLHLNGKDMAFFDDTEGLDKEAGEGAEAEANAFTRDMLIPAEIWDQIASDLVQGDNEGYVVEVAERLKVSPAVVAGRARWESEDYSMYGGLLGNHQVREQFQDYG
jgi:HTH-type transcriptional regulator / antitoxin HigA